MKAPKKSKTAFANLKAAKPTSFLLNKKQIRSIYKQSRQKWTDAYNQQQVDTILHALSNNPGDAHKKNLKNLKNLRLHGQILRSNIIILNTSKLKTNHFLDFIRVLGKLNDSLTNRHESKTKHYADILIKINQNNFMLDRFKPLEKLQFKYRINRLIRSIREMFSKKEDSISANHLHHIRKKLRDITFILKQDQSFKNSKVKDDFYLYMNHLNSALGWINDKSVRISIQKDIKYSSIYVLLPRSLLKALTNALDLLDESINL